MEKIRTRYAPSPTGRFHIGGARTALFSYIFAKHYGGDFLIRIEDTDTERNTEDGERDQIQNLNWLGIKPDYYPGNEDETGPFRQSERLDIYNEHSNKLLENGVLYKCWCTSEELEAERTKAKDNGVQYKYSGKCKTKTSNDEGFVLRVSMPENIELSWEDTVRGSISVNSNDVGDWVAVKANGMPTYNFANVVDDHLMKITNVLRGEEHISNTPKQLHLYDAFGFERPEFGHLTIITDMDGKKLSKRDEETVQFIEEFRNLGYLPEAIFNFLTLLGWSPSKEEEIFSKEKIIKIFDKDRFSKSSSKFDISKMDWINSQYINNLNEEKLFELLNPFVIDIDFSDDKKKKIFSMFKKQINKGSDITGLIEIFVNKTKIDSEQQEYLSENNSVVENYMNQIESIVEWNYDSIKEAQVKTGEITETKGKDLLLPLRLSLTGQTKGPEIASFVEIIGKEETLRRIKNEV